MPEGREIKLRQHTLLAFRHRQSEIRQDHVEHSPHIV